MLVFFLVEILILDLAFQLVLLLSLEATMSLGIVVWGVYESIWIVKSIINPWKYVFQYKVSFLIYFEFTKSILINKWPHQALTHMAIYTHEITIRYS